jgi:hypothetical protein
VSQDPGRWSDASSDAPAELGVLLRHAKDDVPSQHELAALGIVVPASFGTGTAATAATAKLGASAAKGGVAASVSKVTAATVLTVVVGASLYAAYSGDEPQRVDPPARDLATPRETVVTPLVDPMPVTSTTTEAEVQSTEADEVPSSPAPTPLAKPTEELPLLQQARRALGRDPGQALSLVRRHEREFPRGKYVQEREVIRIEALRRLGQSDEANRRSEDFKRRFPGSAHESNVDREGP